MKNKIYRLIISILLISTFFTIIFTKASADQDGDYTYAVSNGEATITKYTGSAWALTIPSTLGGFPTGAIGDNAFNGCTFLTSVSIPNSVSTIGSKAFKSCTSLTSVTIPDKVTSINDEAFYYCSSLNSVFFPINLTTIGNEAFYFCGALESLTIGNNVITIGDNAFGYCTSLTTLNIPDNVTTIGTSTFAFCSSLTTVTIGNSVKTIGNSAFASCSSLTSVTIGNSVKTIGPSAFASCSSLTSIIFLSLSAPTTVGTDWIKGTPAEIRGHAYAASNFPTTEETWHDFHGLKMGETIRLENIKPLAGFIWISTNLTVNQTIIFDASTSIDPDGSLILFEWDWNNDGVYEESYTTPTATHSWIQAGKYPITIRVTDNDNATSTKTITIPIISNKIETNDKETPGFEFILITGAIAVSILLWKKKRGV